MKVEKGKVTGDIKFLNAFEEEQHPVAHAAVALTPMAISPKSMSRRGVKGEPTLTPRDEVAYMDIATNQMFSIVTSMIPFVENDDANRALMGSNMQKQATPCVVPEAPIVATGIEEMAARDTGTPHLCERSRRRRGPQTRATSS